MVKLLIKIIHILILSVAISLIGLVIYRLSSPNLPDEKKKQISYAQIGLSFFASVGFLFGMIIIILLVSHSIVSFNSYFFSSLKTTILAIFYIITSPFSLSLLQYFYQDKLRNYDYIFSILIIISTLFCLSLTFLGMPIKKSNLFGKILSKFIP
jgi:hypothetical protein